MSSLGTINERQTAVYSATLKDESGMAVPASDLESVSLTVTDRKTGRVINSRAGQNVLNANGVTIDEDGLLAWSLEPDDTRIVSSLTPHGSTESRDAVLEYTWDAGVKRGRHDFEFAVRRSALPRSVSWLRGDDVSGRIGGVGDLAGVTAVWLTVKRHRELPDDDAVLMLTLDGLVRLNGSAVTSGGTLSADATDEAVDYTLMAGTMAALTPGDSYRLEVQVKTATGLIETRRELTLAVTGDVVRAIT